MEERRRQPRTSTLARASFSVLEASNSVTASGELIRDFSDGGLCITTEQRLDVGMMLELDVQTPDQTESVRAIGQVVHWRHGNPGYVVGVQFLWVDGSLESSPSQAELIWSYL